MESVWRSRTHGGAVPGSQLILEVAQLRPEHPRRESLLEEDVLYCGAVHRHRGAHGSGALGALSLVEVIRNIFW